MKNLFGLLLLCCLVLSACKSDDEASESFEVTCTYLEIQNGTKLTYKQETFGGATQTIEGEVTSQATIDGILVAVVETNGQESYLTCDGDKFTQSAPAQTQTGGGVTSTTGDILMTLDFGAPIGDSSLVATIVVNQEVQGQSFSTTNTYYGKMVETDQSMTVEGTTYNDVIKYEINVFSESSELPGELFHTSNVVYYIAPQVATIYSEIKDPISGIVLTSVSLVDYEY